MAYEVTYAGIPLHNYIKIRNVKRTVLPSRENFTKNIPSQNGEFYMGYKYAPREITLECTIMAYSREEFIECINELAFILDVNVPSKMIIGDDPDKYVYAILDGTIDVEKIKHSGNINLNFICYDPYIYSVNEDYFEDAPMQNNAKSISIDNSGSTSAYPILDVGFTKEAHFLQCTDSKGRTVLVGLPPDVDRPQGKFDPIVLRESCEVLTNWTNVGNVIDDGIVDGDLIINGGGYGFTCSNFGSGEGWHGGARRRNLGTEVADFRIEVKMEHNSLGDLNKTGAGVKPPVTTTPPATPENPSPSPAPSSAKYKITADPSLRVRQNRGTNYTKLTSIPKGVVVDVSDIQNNWGKVTYNGKTGYICMQYAQYYNPTTTTTSSSSYKTTANLNIRSGRGTGYKILTTIPKGKTLTVSDIQSNWGKVTYNGKTGYSSMKYLSKVSNGKMVRADEVTSDTTAEDRMGKIEVYGFDKNGHKLFKMSMKDTSEWYEHSYPEIQIGSKVELTENSSTPSPKTTTVTDEKDETKTVTKKIDSGKHGDWNEFTGWFTIERKDNYWKCKIEKIDNAGNIVRKIETEKLRSGSYPTGSLSNVVVWFGKYKDNIPVDVMNVSEINVTNIGEPPKPKEIKPIFKNGDSLIVNFSDQTAKVLRNGQTISMMQHLDIGSEFFSCPTGRSQIGIKSDDNNIDVSASIRKRWL